MKAMILAAGRGERMRPLTDATPKPLLKVGGKALIEYHLENIKQAGIHDVVINLAWLGEQIESQLGDGSRYGLCIEYSREGEALETAGGILRALPLLGDEPFIVINGDIWSNYSFDALPPSPTGLAHLVLVNNPPHHPAGDFMLQAGDLLPSGPTCLTFSGMGLYRPELFVGLKPGKTPLGPLLREAMHDQSITGEHHTGLWFDIGSPERLQELDGLMTRWAQHG